MSTFTEVHPTLEDHWRSVILFGRNVSELLHGPTQRPSRHTGPAWLLNFTAFCYGWLCFPRRVFRAFVRGRRTRNLYHEGWRDAFLDETIGRVRRRLELVQTTPGARPSDIGLYLVWVMIAIVSTVGIGTILGRLLIGVARLLAG